MGNLLVVGARKGSLGHYISEVASAQDWDVITAGVSGEEHVPLDVTNYTDVEMLFSEDVWHSIVCTAGINYEGSIAGDTFYGQLDDSMRTNAIGPLHLLHRWAQWWLNNIEHEGASADTPNTPLHFVAASSNSAHIARSKSLAYCTSKAALSMGIRCAARELAGTWLNVWGVEPGWLSGTPMSADVTARLALHSDKPAHRIPGDRTVDPAALAHFIVGGIRNPYSSLNGCMIRMDGGEQ